MSGPGTNTGHGRVWERPDGMMAKCGGPGLCRQCNWDASHFCVRASGAPVGSRVYSTNLTAAPPPPRWGLPPLSGIQAPAATPVPVGCICPPGANLTCERPDCPRKAVRT